MKSRLIVCGGVALILSAGACAGSAGATPPVGDVDRTDLAKGTSDAPIAIVAVGQPTTLYVQNVRLGPGASSGWHTHPGPEYSAVNAGTVHLQTATSCTPTAFPAGQAIFIPAGVPHVVFNEGLENAEAVVTYTLPADRPVRDDAPASCP